MLYVNAAAALLAAVIWLDALVAAMRLHARVAAAASTVAFAASVWYAGVYTCLSLGMWADDLDGVVPLFRYVFVVAVLAPPIRHLGLRRARRDLAQLYAPVGSETL